MIKHAAASGFVPLIPVFILLIFLSLTGGVHAGLIEHCIPIGPFEIEEGADGHEIRLENFGTRNQPGMPRLPRRIFSFAIPPGARVTAIDITGAELIDLAGIFQVAPAPAPGILGDGYEGWRAKQLKLWQKSHDTVYESHKPYPEKAGTFVREAGFRKYRLLDIEITPFKFAPAEGRLSYHPAVEVKIAYEIPGDGGTPAILDYSPRMEESARDIIYNYHEAQGWYPPPDQMRSRDIKDFVIITPNALSGSVTPLVTWETAKGRNPEVVTTEWISANYGGLDMAEKIRNFLRDKYPTSEWGIEDVLLAANVDYIPMRTGCEDVGYGRPKTDYYYAELSLPDDQSWDLNGNYLYGEPDGDQIDFYAEVNLGRIPWTHAANLQYICQKSVAFEQNNDPDFKNNILLLGAFWYATDDAAVLMEVKSDHAWLSDWTMTRMYEQNGDYWSAYACDLPLLRTNVVNVWSNSKFAYVNWGGHGSATTCHILGLGAPAFINAADCASLNDNYPAIICACCCYNVNPDYANIGRAMLLQGGVGFLGSSQVTLGSLPWNDPTDGSGQSCDYWFTNHVLSGNYAQGDAHRRAMLRLYQEGGWHLNHYETYCWNLWGHPNLKLGGDPPVNHDPELSQPGLTPDVGYYGTRFEFTVKYYDVDEDAPAAVYVNIDGSDHAMTLSSGPAADGFYRYRTRDLDAGTAHAYYFTADDGRGKTDRLPLAGTYSGPSTFNPDLYLSGTPGAGQWMTVDVWGCADAVWASAWSSETGPYYLPASGLTYDIGPGDLHMAKRIVDDPYHLDAYGYGSRDFRIPNSTPPGMKYIQATTKMNAYWAKTNRESFLIP
jgi:hypothetical protein